MNSNRSERPAYDDGSPLGTERSHVMQMASFLRKQDLVSTWIESEPLAARATVAGDNVMWLLSGLSVPGEYTVFISHFPGKVPVERRKAGVEAITRANLGLGLGAFELNLETGILIFRTAIPSTTREIDPLNLGWMLAIHQDVFDHYFGALMSVIYGRVDPAEAIGRVEETCQPAQQPVKDLVNEPTGGRENRPELN